ncbi:MAG: hypothetical protein EAZ14_09890, partial [Runella slithyformis]
NEQKTKQKEGEAVHRKTKLVSKCGKKSTYFPFTNQSRLLYLCSIYHLEFSPAFLSIVYRYRPMDLPQLFGRFGVWQ